MGQKAFKALEFGKGSQTEKALKEIWSEFDKDDSGFLEKAEADSFFEAYLTAHKVKKDDIEYELGRLWKDLDANQDGKISFVELVAAVGVTSGVPLGEASESSIVGTYKHGTYTVVISSADKRYSVNDVDTGVWALESDAVTKVIHLGTGTECQYVMEMNHDGYWVLRDNESDIGAAGDVLVTFDKEDFTHE